MRCAALICLWPAVLLLAGCNPVDWTPDGTFYMVDADSRQAIAGVHATLIYFPPRVGSMGPPGTVVEETSSDLNGCVVFTHWQAGNRAVFEHDEYNGAHVIMGPDGDASILESFSLGLGVDRIRNHGEVYLRRPVSNTGDNPGDLAYEYTNNLIHCQPSKIWALYGSADTGIALAAGWQIMQDGLRYYSDFHNREQEPDPAAINRFCGFVEGRLGAVPPQFWRSAVSDLAFPYRRHGYAPTRRGLAAGEQGNPPEFIAVNHTRSAYTIDWQNRRWVIPLPAQAPKPKYRSFENATPGAAVPSSTLRAVALADPRGARVFIALYEPHQAECRLACFNANGELRWAQDVWIVARGSWWAPRPQDPHSHAVSLLLHGDDLYLFGAGNAWVYLQACGQLDGKPRFRFSTGLLQEYSVAWTPEKWKAIEERTRQGTGFQPQNPFLAGWNAH